MVRHTRVSCYILDHDTFLKSCSICKWQQVCLTILGRKTLTLVARIFDCTTKAFQVNFSNLWINYCLAHFRATFSRFIGSFKFQPLYYVYPLEIALLRNRSVHYVILSAKYVRRVLCYGGESLDTRYSNERESSRYILLIQISTRMAVNFPFQI